MPRRTTFVMFLTLLAIGALASASNVPVEAQATQLKAIAPAGPITVPEQFSVDVNVTDVADLFSWQIKLYYNATVLRWINVTLPPEHVFDGQFFFSPDPVNSSDGEGTYILCTASITSNQSLFGGDGILCRIYFEAQVAGTSELNFSRLYGDWTYLWNYDLSPIPAELVDSSVTTQGADTRAPTAISINADKNFLVIGENVTISGTINVTVPNGTPVCVEYYDNDFWRPLATVYTENSNYTYNWAPTDEGDFKIRSKWNGDATNYKPAISEEAVLAVIIPEFPSITTLLLIVTFAAIMLVITKKKFLKTSAIPKPDQ